MINEVIISPQELVELKKYKDVLLLDLSALENYTNETIAQAIHLPYEKIVHGELPCPNILPTEEKFAQTLAEVGYQNGMHIVAFDDEYGLKAARLCWTLAMANIPDFSYLNGGLASWKAEGYEGISPKNSNEMPKHPRSSDTPLIHFAVDSPCRASAEQILTSLEKEEYFLWDTRSYGEWSGEDRRAQRGGHIPGAYHLEWNSFLDAQGRIKPKEHIARILNGFFARKRNPQQQVVAYCQSHRRSSIAFLVAAYVGIPIRAYDGSWQEWGNSPDLPVDTEASE